ncbi:MAG: hypothetical protein FD161_1089 [Limisphaerales bacterium]|nr:MAG: hypothetical protein FD161_1089 [Limisphaerales bacterium]KAG0509872.1 MAG: hypothetical protein E1N63_1089 [Limisphaerales bacterium]TXT50906.1 MAG: hypothetical protein FD140_1968 [Limisphaerales bacterium]
MPKKKPLGPSVRRFRPKLRPGAVESAAELVRKAAGIVTEVATTLKQPNVLKPLEEAMALLDQARKRVLPTGKKLVLADIRNQGELVIGIRHEPTGLTRYPNPDHNEDLMTGDSAAELKDVVIMPAEPAPPESERPSAQIVECDENGQNPVLWAEVFASPLEIAPGPDISQPDIYYDDEGNLTYVITDADNNVVGVRG